LDHGKSFARFSDACFLAFEKERCFLGQPHFSAFGKHWFSKRGKCEGEKKDDNDCSKCGNGFHDWHSFVETTSFAFSHGAATESSFAYGAAFAQADNYFGNFGFGN